MIQIIKNDYDGKMFDNDVKYWIDRFNIWHKEIGRGAYIMENGGNGYCPLVPKMCDNGIFVSGSWSYFMDNINELDKKVLEHYPTDRYGLFIVESFLQPAIIYFLELVPGLPDDLEIKKTWHNGSEFLKFVDDRIKSKNKKSKLKK